MLPAKARSCSHAWLANNAKDEISSKKSQIKAKHTEIVPEKGQTITPVFLSHNTYFDKQTDGQTDK